MQSFRLGAGRTGIPPSVYERVEAIGFGTRNRADDTAHSYLSIIESSAALPDPRRHHCFRATARERVDRFYDQGLVAGGSLWWSAWKPYCTAIDEPLAKLRR